MGKDMQQPEIRRIGLGDLSVFIDLVGVFQKAFTAPVEGVAHSSYLNELLDREGMVIIIVVLEGRVVGGLTAHEMPRWDRPSTELYIYDIGILPEFQRRGLGRKLMEFLQVYARNRGIRDYFVEANLEDRGAISFYRAIGGSTEPVVHFNFTSGPDREG